MNVLFLSQVLPFPLDAGPKVRAYYVLRQLEASGHRVSLLAFTRPSDPPAALDHLRRWIAAVHTVPMPRGRARDAAAFAKSLAGGQPFLIARDAVPDMFRQATALAREAAPDLVHADQLWMAPYALAAADAAPARPRTVLDQHNAVFQVPLRLARSAGNPLRAAALRREAAALARFEVETCRRFDRVVWVTDQDRAAFEQVREALEPPTTPPMPPFTTLPICVDPGAIAPLTRQPGACRVTFLGGMHWPPNAEGITWFARTVWPRLRQAAPDAVLTVIGKQPPAALARLGDAVEVTGYVEDPAPYLAETAAFIVPLFAGGGMRVKITEAWARGLPVVTTPIGGEGLAVEPGVNALVAETPGGFAESVALILQQPGLARQLATAGRATVERHYDWRTVYQAWDHVFHGAP